jgi:hypothetical protein
LVQTDFIALYRGQTVAEARLVAVTAEPDIVSRFVRELAGETETAEEQDEAQRRRSLHVVGHDVVDEEKMQVVRRIFKMIGSE